MMPCSPQEIFCLDSEHLQMLHHELSDHFEARSVVSAPILRSKGEAQALLAWCESEVSTPASFCAFVDQLERLNRLLTGDTSKRRRSKIATSPDREGIAIEFPDVVDVEKGLYWLWQKIHIPTGEHDAPILVATAALVLLTNAHLFSDGNGRLSRALFNYILHRAGLPVAVYIPVYELALRSRGGFLIRVRQAELRNAWNPLVEYVVNMLEICRKIDHIRMAQSLVDRRAP